MTDKDVVLSFLSFFFVHENVDDGWHPTCGQEKVNKKLDSKSLSVMKYASNKICYLNTCYINKYVYVHVYVCIIICFSASIMQINKAKLNFFGWADNIKI